MLLILVLLSLAASEACGAMSAVTAKQLQCVFPSLDATSASTYAQWMSKLMGTPLRTTTSCQWAAMLGNIGGETDGLKQLSQSSCSENQPFCARGPLSLFSEEQYRFCSSNSLCYNCANIVEEPSQVSSDAAVGVGSAACAWGALFGENLNLRADGSHAGFMQTAKLLSCGHLSCEEPTAWGKRLMYWMKATACLSEEAPEPAAYNSYNSGDSYSTYSASNTGNNGYGTYSSYNSNTGYTQSSSNGNSQSSSNGYSQTSASYTGYSQSSSNGYSQSSSNGYSQTSGSYTGYYSSSNNGVSTSSSASSGPASTGYNSYSTGDNSNSYNSYNSGNNGYNSYNSGNSGYNSYSGNSYGGGNQ